MAPPPFDPRACYGQPPGYGVPLYIQPPQGYIPVPIYPGIVAGWIPILGGIAGLYTLVAGLSPLWDSRRQGFHDKVVHTDVIKVR